MDQFRYSTNVNKLEVRINEHLNEFADSDLGHFEVFFWIGKL